MTIDRATKALHLYRHILHLSGHLKDVRKRPEAIAFAQSKFREHWGERDEVKVDALLKQAESRLGWLRMMTPRIAHRGFNQGETRFVYQSGEGTEGGVARKQVRARYTNWSGSNMDPDSVAKHNNLLNRGGWINNAHAKGMF